MRAKTHARSSDPETSQEAAEQFIDSSKASGQIERIAAAVKALPGLVAGEIAIKARLTENQISKRAADAHRQGLIHPIEGKVRKWHGYSQREWFPGPDPTPLKPVRHNCPTCFCVPKLETDAGQIGMNI